jgi:Armadillo/beta-catenin-like repeat
MSDDVKALPTSSLPGANSNIRGDIARLIAHKRGLSVSASDRNVSDDQALVNAQRLGKVTKHRRAAVRLARNKDTIQDLLSSIKTRPRFVKLISYSIECVRNLAIDEVSIEEIIEEGTLDVLRDVLRVNPYNEELQQLVNATLQKMCINDRLAAMVANAFGPDPMIHSLNKHVELDTIQSTCDTLGMLMKDQESRDKYVDAGVIDALANVIKNNANDPNIVAAAAAALNAIAADPKYADVIMKTGAVELILEALARNPNNAKLVEHGVAFLGNLARASPEILARLKELGALDVIVAAVESHPENRVILEIGAATLAAMTTRDDVGDALGGVNSTDSNEQAKAIVTVGSLALVDENVQFIVETGGIADIIGAIKSAVDSKEDTEARTKILEAGCRSLARLATNENNIYSIMKEGGIKVVKQVLRGNMHDERVVAAALAALAQMCAATENEQYVEYIAKVGAPQMCVDAIRAHPDSRRVAKNALDLIQQMCAYDSVVPLVVDAGVIPEIVELMKRFKDDPEILKAAINALGQMAVTPENIKQIADAGGFEQVIEAMLNNIDDAELVEKALLLLDTAALIPENVELLQNLGAMDAILKAMEAHPDNADIQEIGARALGKFATDEQVVAIIDNIKGLVSDLRKAGHTSAAKGIIAKLGPALGLLGNLALVEENQQFLMQKNCVDMLMKTIAVASALPPSPERDVLLSTAVRTLARLATIPENAEAILKCGALNQILDIALANPDNERLAENALLLAEALAAHQANADSLVQSGAISKLVKLADENPLNGMVLSRATKILGFIAGNPANARAVVNGNGAGPVVEAILNSLTMPEDLMVALAVLSNLAVDDQTVAKLVGASAIEAIIEAMRANPTRADVLIQCMQALGRLAINAEVAKEIGDRGAIPLVCKAMRDHHDNEPLIETAMMLLRALGMVPENAKLMYEELNVDELAQWAKEVFPDNMNIVQCADEILESLGLVVNAEPELVEVDGHALSSFMQEATLTRPQILDALSQIQAMVNMDDPSATQLFIENGGMDALAQLALANANDEEVFKATALAFKTLLSKLDEPENAQFLAHIASTDAVAALLQVLKPNESFVTPVDATAMAAACQLLARMAESKENVDMIVAQGALPLMMELLTNSEDPELLEAAARALAKLSNNPEVAKLLANEATIKALIEAMRRHIDKPGFLKYAVYLLGNLAINDHCKDLINIHGGIPLILEIMRRYPELAELLENCCFALANLSYHHPKNVGAIMVNNGPDTVIAMMRAHAGAEGLLESACLVLTNVGYEGDVNRDIIVKAGGARVIVDSALGNFNAVSLLNAAYGALGTLAQYQPNIAVIIREGAVAAVVAGLTVHPMESDLVRTCMGLLSYLAAQPDSQNMAIMAQEGAVQAVVEVLVNHNANAEVAVLAVYCLSNLAREPYNSTMMVKQGGVKAVTDSMANLSFDTDLLQNSVRLIGLLTNQELNIRRLMADGGGLALVQAVHQESKHPKITFMAVRAFHNAAYASEFAEMLARQGAIQATLNVWMHFTSTPKAIMNCFRTLGRLCNSESNAEAMAEASLKQAESTLPTYFNNADIIAYGMAFLGNLLRFQVAAEYVQHTQIIQSIVTCAKYHLSSAHVQYKCLSPLENMAQVSANVRTSMRQSGAVELLKELKSQVPQPDVKSAIQKLIDMLDTDDSKQEAGPGGSWRDVFGDDVDDDDDVPPEELPIEIRNMLVSGELLQKHSKTAPPRPRHVFVTDDLKWLCWKDPKKPFDFADETKRMRVYSIRGVERGRFTMQLKRKNIWGKHLAKQECAWAVLAAGKEQRSVNLECNSEADRERWVKAIDEWVRWAKWKKKNPAKFK